MKRTKFLALVLAVSIMLLGAGYAYWSQDLTITNTVDTGELKVDISDLQVTTPNDSYMTVPTGTYNGQSLTLDITKAYPGADFTLDFDLVNNGTLKAYVNQFSITSESDPIVNQIFCRELSVAGTSISLADNTLLATALTKINALNGDKGIELDTTGTTKTINVKMELEFNPDADESAIAEKAENLSFTIKADVDQYNGVSTTE